MFLYSTIMLELRLAQTHKLELFYIVHFSAVPSFFVQISIHFFANSVIYFTANKKNAMQVSFDTAIFKNIFWYPNQNAHMLTKEN